MFRCLDIVVQFRVCNLLQISCHPQQAAFVNCYGGVGNVGLSALPIPGALNWVLVVKGFYLSCLEGDL